MYDKEVVFDILDQIRKRFTEIDTASDFLESDQGREKLDSICMQLINIGEALKRIDKITDNELLLKYPQIEWKKVMGMWVSVWKVFRSSWSRDYPIIFLYIENGGIMSTYSRARTYPKILLFMIL